MDHQHVLRQAVFLFEVLATLVALFWQTEKGGEWKVIWCLRRPQIIHDVGFLCISIMWLCNFFLVKRTLKQELQVEETSGKRDRGEFDLHALLHHQAVLHYTLLPLALHLLLIITILLLLLLLRSSLPICRLALFLSRCLFILFSVFVAGKFLLAFDIVIIVTIVENNFLRCIRSCTFGCIRIVFRP